MLSYVINLDRRVERWYYIREHLADLDIKPIRFPAIDNKWKGCRDSHLAIIEKCFNMPDVTEFAIYEDDAKFLQPWSIVEEAMSQLPDSWDCLYLGASPQVPQERYSDNLFRLYGAWTTHAMIWHKRRGGAIEYILNHKSDIGKIDVFMSNIIQANFGVFVTYPMVATQVQFQSDTCHRSDVSTIEVNYKKFCI